MGVTVCVRGHVRMELHGRVGMDVDTSMGTSVGHGHGVWGRAQVLLGRIEQLR